MKDKTAEKADKEQSDSCKSPAIIIVEPQLGENIGTAARAMANFGLSELRLVNPRDGWPNTKAQSAAAGADYVIDNVKIFQTLDEAIADIHRLYATTARPRDMVKKVQSPDESVAEMHQLVHQGLNVGVLFGRERYGLSNDEIALADAVIMAPVNPDFASLNLAQAIMIISYEWLKSSQNNTLGRITEFDGPSTPGLNRRGNRPANKQELLNFFEHLERELDESGFLKPPEKRPIMVRSIRNMFQRMDITEQEVRTLRGIVASLTRLHKQRRNVP